MVTPESSLVEFSYVSRVAAEVSRAAIFRMAHDSFRFNVRSGLSGHLAFDDGQFSQVIEGPSELVLPLASRILTDARHRDISITAFGSIEERRFAEWRFFGFECLEPPRWWNDGLANVTVFRPAIKLVAGLARQAEERMRFSSTT